MEHLSAAVPGQLEPEVVHQHLAHYGNEAERLESQSVLVTTADGAAAVRGEAVAYYERVMRLARAGYAPLCSMPLGSFVAPEFDALGLVVSALLCRLRKVVEHCHAVEQLVRQRDQAEIDREHRRRFPREMDLLDNHRDLLGALYPDRWLLLYDGMIRGEFDTAQQAVQAGDLRKGRDGNGQARFLVFCHRPPYWLS